MGNLSDKEKENALNEVRILASITHPNIISYKEAFIDEPSECLCIVMEYADAGDAFQLMCSLRNENKWFTEDEIWRIFIQTARGLQQLHDMRIMHRDLKSANIFLFNDGSVKLGDLNVSKVMNKGWEYTQTGTPYYASPEVWKDQPYNSKSDIWSLGWVMYELICQRPPFDANSMDELYKAVVKGKFDPIPVTYSASLDKVISSLIKISPSKRPTWRLILNDPCVVKWSNKLFSQNMESQKTLKYYANSGNSPSKSSPMNNLIKTIRNCKNMKTLATKLPAPKYEIDTHSHSIDDIRRETPDMYTNILRKDIDINRDSVNISVKRTRGKSNKRNYDYLEVEISDPTDNQGKL